MVVLPLADKGGTRERQATESTGQTHTHTEEIKASTSTVAALFSKMALTGQRLAMVDMVLLVFTAFSYLP